MRLFESRLFFGAGEHTKLDVAVLEHRFRAALSMAGGSQQPGGTPEERREGAAFVGDVVRDIAVALTGHDIHFAEEAPYPGPPLDQKRAVYLQEAIAENRRRPSKDTFTIYEARIAVTDNEGIARSWNLVGFFSDRDEAETSVWGKGSYGENGSVRTRSAVRLNLDVYLLDRDHPEPIDLNGDEAKRVEALRASAKAKLTATLTDEEIAALGFDLTK